MLMLYAMMPPLRHAAAAMLMITPLPHVDS